MNTKYIHIGKSTILWEKTSFSRAFKFLKNNSLSRAELSDDNGNVKNIHYGDILIKFSECLYADEGNSIPYIINDNIAYKLLKLSPLINGDIVFADAAEDNTVGKCIEIITHNDTDLVAGLHTIPCRPTIKFAEGYLGYYLNSSAFHNQLLQYIQGTKISSISKKSICQTIISYPSEIINQQKIASYFQSLDSLIQSTSKKLVSLKQVKAASLQSMFPQEGETVPKVRFKGFEEEWKYEILGKISSISIGEFVIQTKQRANAPYPVYNGGITNTGYYDYFNQEGPKIIISARGANAGFISKYKNRFWAGNSCYSIGINNNNWEFIYYFLQSKQDSYLKEQQAANIPSISKKQIYTTNVLLPCYNEQIKIGLFFSNLDKQISLQTQRLEKLKQIKAACLDKMFV
ncbi:MULTISPECIES: restriction endonuclease subunit S [Bacteroidales]|uniref:restriction endonuclease subunit S n=1 Tax=Bacteroidales TaxID=171549 RepID=UPI001D6B1FFE|nr:MULTISPECIES: restriction endonuclease subunit S [Bacteroidales]MCS3351381.1 restriction endonuclease subunit S [Bacteroides uniformis]HJF43636.1 restriction endonuclease subunit S [Coprobacter fastidiosus]